jgi:uncharacterized protein YbbK (DUF523 family)
VHLDLKARLRLGVSSCLAGEPVRYDGNDKRDHWLMDRVACFSEVIAFCPEAVLGVPREKISLHRARDTVRVLGDDSRADHTDRLDAHANTFLDQLDLDALDGWVFKKNSPSCAVRPIDVFENGQPAGKEPGRFASTLLDRCAWLPLIDEEQLAEPAERRHFLERAFARAGWREFLGDMPEVEAERDAAVAGWISRFELQLLARERAPLSAHAGCCDLAVLRSHAHLLFASLDAEPTRVGQAAALRRAGEHLDVLDHELAGLAILITEYEHDRIDVEVPRQVLRGLCARGGDRWLRRQRFLDPFPLDWQDPESTSLPWPARGRDRQRT